MSRVQPPSPAPQLNQRLSVILSRQDGQCWVYLPQKAVLRNPQKSSIVRFGPFWSVASLWQIWLSRNRLRFPLFEALYEQVVACTIILNVLLMMTTVPTALRR
jgi:hypothetical protein